MVRCAAILTVLLALGARGANGGDNKKKDPPKSNEVEVKFADGSTVRMVLVQESIDVVTKFGKLTVPLGQIRGIDLGIHLPEGMEKKIEDCIKRLGSEKFKDRDIAVSELIEMGPRAYPALVHASKSADLEVQQRIQTALTKIKAKVPENMLRLTSNDRIITTEFPIVGTIVSPALRAKTKYFGDLDLKLTELRSIAWVSANLDAEFNVDAAKYAMNNQWLDTGVVLDGNTGMTVVATGEVDLLNDGSGQFVCGPTGSPNIGRRGANNRLPGTLIGKIGESGTPFTIGDRYSTMTAPAGKLYLSIVPVPFNNGQLPTGAFKTVIRAGFFFGQS